MIVPLFLPHLGCGERCTYCNQDHITNSGQGDALERRIAALLGGLAAPAEVALYGGNMLGLPALLLDRILRLLDPYRDRIAHLRVSAKPGPLDADTLALLKKHRVRTIELGIPTFNDDILAVLKRGHTVDDLHRTYHILRGEGFETGLQVMVGLPGETPGDVRETASAIRALAPAFIRIYPLCVIDDTPLCRDFRAGRFSPDSVERAVAKAAFISLSAYACGVATIKMGLTGNDVLTEKIVAGPFHPAFGYLVKSEAFYLAVLKTCAVSAIRGPARVRLNRRDVAHLTGYRRSNLSRLKESGITTTWAEDEKLEEGRFVIESGGMRAEGGVTDALAMIPL
ncbi:MAG: radical SAM protein [Syntrophorhabdales bacterium]|jgi:histone acetyltransferase (RNA polymerase elongator complex component)